MTDKPKCYDVTPTTPQWYDPIEKYCGDNDLNFGSAHDRMIAMDMIPEGNKCVCSVCKEKFDYAITGHFVNYSNVICNKCLFISAMHYRIRGRLPPTP